MKRHSDFFAWSQPVDWIITNPPWSQIRRFLQHALAHLDHIVFLLTINHLWTRARLRELTLAGFGIRETVVFDNRSTFPPMGFQLGAVYLNRGRTGPMTLVNWSTYAAVESDQLAPVEENGSGSRPDRPVKRPKIDKISKELDALNYRLDTLLAGSPQVSFSPL